MKKNLLIIGSVLCLGIGTVKAQYNVIHEFNDTTGKEAEGELTLSGTTLYGMTSDGGATNNGNIFSVNITGSAYTDLHDFNGTDGNYPSGDLTYVGGLLYGMTPDGGTNHVGNIFSIKANGSGFRVLLNFNGTSSPMGSTPQGSLLLIGKVLYGIANMGGAFNSGCIFSVDTNGGGYRDLYDFNGTTGAEPKGSLTLSGHKFYGTTYYGGVTYNSGVVFSIDTNGSGYTVLHEFNTTAGEEPVGTLVLSGKVLYGMAYSGGADYYGCIFSVDTNGNSFKDMLDFDINNGEYPLGSLIYSSGKLFGMTSLGGVSYLSGCIFSIDTNGSGYTHILDLWGTEGANPHGGLILSGNTFYGMTYDGGNVSLGTGPGTIFGYKDVGLGVNNITATQGTINVYPNPSNGVFTVVLSHPELVSGSQTIEVYNMLGEKVYSASLPQTPIGALNEINISNQPNGIYLYRVIATSGEPIGEGKMIIQK